MFSEIYDILGADLASRSCVIVTLGKKAIIQGYKKIAKISDEQVVLIEKNKKMFEISGKFLQISSLAPGELVVSGKIEHVGEYHEN
ncbi:MAG: YabP/YqfC family sporulation protein [Clostridia bacterium]|nr:YabP/YqfC family sporulation protein [Clostridia bacterium]